MAKQNNFNKGNGFQGSHDWYWLYRMMIKVNRGDEQTLKKLLFLAIHQKKKPPL
jgi:hypothetical protein